jgi:DNA helicase-2/ATP-dependent DNA helicase PcrA
LRSACRHGYLARVAEALPDPFATLNERQHAAVRHGGGPLLIVAGAGTGKTTTLAHRVAHLILEGTSPERILLVTFARRAAAEMLRRVEGILRELRRGSATAGAGAASAGSARVWGGTFHSVATRLLRLHGQSIGLAPQFTIHDRPDSQDLMDVLRAELDLARGDRRFPKKATCLDIYSRCVNTRERLPDLLDRAFPWCKENEAGLRALFGAYSEAKAAQSVLDYDDLLVFLHGLLADPAASAAVRARFDAVLVDEYQDTNALQADTLALLCEGGRGLTVVGDDAQSIYSFRGATVRNILDFPARFEGASVVALEQSYRSTSPLLEATNRVIAQARERHDKELWSRRAAGEKPSLVTCQDEEEQTEFVISRILAHREEGIELRRQAVLFRAAHHSLQLEIELGRRNIPFHKYGGLKFVEAAHVKDLLAFLRLAENARDRVAGTRVLTLLPGVGPRTARALLDSLGRAEAPGDWSRLKPPAAAAHLWPAFAELMAGLAAPEAGAVAAQVHRVRGFYAPLLEQKYDHAQARVRDLEQLEQVAAGFADRHAFLADLTLDPPSSTQELAGPPTLDDDYLVLSTIHSAKGLEWDAVYVLHAADGNLPSDLTTGKPEEVEEELRLFYVALSRAKDWLYVCFPLRWYNRPAGAGGAHTYAQLTRFLPEPIRASFRQYPAAVRAEPSPLPVAQVTAADIRRGLQKLW